MLKTFNFSFELFTFIRQLKTYWYEKENNSAVYNNFIIERLWPEQIQRTRHEHGQPLPVVRC